MNETTRMNDMDALRMFNSLDSSDKAIVTSLTEMLASAIASTVRIQLAVRQKDNVKAAAGKD